ncbi:hypothetical protein [Epilithonimonas zeae]|uniref:hypothetical protein n=1 Tax=Epilithonimonas zeae TaxID=1416779 RepID=UPI00200BDE5F|nr:hypothetical protein [Epilithonimonas zeae]UQB67793.1 hypothetical protein KI430_12215 [Epilithonimonas zeae]
MKWLIRIILIVISIPIIFFLVFSIYYANHKSKFFKVKNGMQLSNARAILGNPDESKYYDNQIMDVYYYFPMSEARFFYSKKDSTLVRSWRTDAD